MGRISTLSGENMTLGVGNVLFSMFTPPAGNLGSRLKVKRFEVCQSGTTTLEMIRAEFFTRTTAGTLTTTSLSPTTIKPLGGPPSAFGGNTSVIGGAARSGINSSADSGGTYTTIFPFTFPNTAGYLYKPAQDEELEIPPNTVFGARLLKGPTSINGWTFTLEIEEEVG